MHTIVGFRASMLMGALSLLASTAESQRIQMPVGHRLTWIGARWNVGARVIDARGQAVAATLAYRMADPTVASVNNRGEVVARKPGNTRVWAIAGRDSASALVMVDPWPARFSFSPAQIRLDAIGARQPIRVVASDSAGIPIVGATSRVSACRSVNERVVTIIGDSLVAVANGTTWVRCADRGIADSVRAEVRQRAVTASISNKAQLVRKSVGDTFSVRVVARDRLQRDVADARPTWASLSPATVSVDPLTGKARAVNGGSAKIVVQVGDIADSTTISIEGTAAYTPPTPTAAVVDTTNRSRALMTAQETFIFENDTTGIALSVTDSTGLPVSLANVRMRILDTTIAIRVDSTRVFGRKNGVTQLVATYGTLVDTFTVSVRPRPVGGAAISRDSTGADAGFVAPPTFQDSIPAYQRIRTDIIDSIATNPNLAGARQRLVFTAMAVGAIAEHLSRTEAGIVEDRTGAMYGGAGSLMLFQRLEFAAGLRLGTLSSVQDVGEDLKVTEAEASLGYFPLAAIGIRAGGLLRGASSDIATVTWMIPKVSLVTRFSFIGDVINTYAAFSLLPAAKFKGLADQVAQTGTLFGRGGEAGLEVKRGRLNAAVTYFVEQISFAETARLESFSAVRLRLGLNLGR